MSFELSVSAAHPMTKCTREDQDTGEIAPQDRARQKKKKKINK